jgi:hypothetical protein
VMASVGLNLNPHPFKTERVRHPTAVAAVDGWWELLGWN